MELSQVMEVPILKQSDSKVAIVSRPMCSLRVIVNKCLHITSKSMSKSWNMFWLLRVHDTIPTMKIRIWDTVIRHHTMYDFYDSIDTLKFWTEKMLLIKLFCFSSDFEVTLNSDENQKSFFNSNFFCSEFQSVNRLVKIVHSARCSNPYSNWIGS